MVEAKVDNEYVSKTIAANGSISVPTDETWKVTITVSRNAELGINGTTIVNSGTNNGEDNAVSFSTVVADGDTIAETTGSDGIHIGGFVVS